MATPTGDVPPDTNHGPTFLIVTGILTVIAVGLCSARIYSRIRPKVDLRADDYLILLATILCGAKYFVAIVCCVHGWGHHSAYVAPNDLTIALKGLFAQEIMWLFAISIARISIAYSLLRLGTGKAWKCTLWTTIVVQILLYIGLMVFLLFNCSSIRANWEPVYNLTCWDRKYILVFGRLANSMLATVDIILALMPVRLIRTLNRPTAEKILICCLMATGIAAGVVSVYSITLSDKVFGGNLLSTTVTLSLWCSIELLLGVIAACLPFLKASTERLLRRFGLLADRPDMTKPSFVRSIDDQESQQRGFPESSDSSTRVTKVESQES